ncbi:MAG TPA: o-succinylbenzoate--CoA ligase [Acidobacteriota bacterium]|nr:o-succinylbenzoate--CoA ligase [Acidobacteriota bacterium]
MSDFKSLTARAAREYHDLPALVSAERAVSYGEYSELVCRAASNLTALGMQPSQRVALLGDNSLEYVVSLMAVIEAGGVACPVPARLPNAAARELIERTDCSYVVTLAEDAGRAVPTTTRQIQPALLQRPVRVARPAGRVTLEQDATIIFTSGSSAPPKAVLHSLGNHYFSALGSNANIPVNPGDRWLLSLPLYHVGGLAILFRVLLGGGAVVIPSPGDDLAQSIENTAATHLSLVPTQLYRLTRQSKKLREASLQLKALLLGGAPAPRQVIDDALASGLPVLTSYGLTEMASQVTTTQCDDPPEKLATCGRVLEYRDLKMSERGEILVRGKTLFAGYVDRSRIIRPFDPDGWFATGDVGRTDTDGYLEIHGRIDNMFISGGENIHPEEIEQAMMAVDGVQDAIVVGIPDQEFGARPVAFVRMADNRPEPAGRRALTHILSERLPRFKIPDSIYPWPEEFESSGLKARRRYFADLAQKLAARNGYR